MAPWAVVFASFPWAFSGAASAPGCSCQVPRCCEVFDNCTISDNCDSLWRHFEGFNNSAVAGSGGWQGLNANVARCQFLNLVPGALHKESGKVVCSDLARAMETTVCEAIGAESRNHAAGAGIDLLSTFLELGSCSSVPDITCGESQTTWSPEGGRCYGWDLFRQSFQFPDTMCRTIGATGDWVQMQMKCDAGQLRVGAKWMDGMGSQEPCAQQLLPDYSVCGIELHNISAWSVYSRGFEATLMPGEWMGGPGDSPRWRCFDIPNSDYHIMVHIAGEQPCATVAPEPGDVVGAGSSTGLSGSFYMAAAVVASGFMT